MVSKRLIPIFVISLAAATANAQEFASRCAPCHGSDGAGGERGPNIVDGRRSFTQSRQGLHDVIHNGIPESGMPAFPLPEATLNSIVDFVISLRSPAADQKLPGDPEAGKRFFTGKGKCDSCHMIRGAGGVLGPDLSNVGGFRRVAFIDQSLREPSAIIAPGYKLVTAQLKNGKTLQGLAKNESDYDLQLHALDGSLQLLLKRDVKNLVHEPQSLMPKLNGTPDEVRDLTAYLAGLRLDGAPFTAAPNPSLDTGVSSDELANPTPGNWPSYHGRLSGNRHSPLKGINTTNVGGLAPKWYFPIGNARRLELTPVVVDGVMYVTTANEVFALDARSGRQIWHYARPLTKGVIGDAGGAINRGVAVLGERVFLATDDAHVIALHRANGNLLWDAEMADFRQHYGATSAPLVAGNLVLSGTSGGDEGARGFIDAFNVATGEHAWRFWTMPKPGEPLSETWVGRAIEHGCATAWLTGTFDPAANLIYWPTGNPCPDYNGDERKGDNLYSSSVVALEPATGKLRWYYQFTPHDLHDWDAAQTPMLVDTEFGGRPRKLLLQGNRNGFFYVLDRLTGEFLLGQPFVKKMNWASGIGADGRPKVLKAAEPTTQGTKACPAVEGATNWMSTAFNPDTGLFYLMALESCNIYTKSSAWWEPGQSFYGGGTRRVPGEPGQKFLRALDVKTGKIVWEMPQVGSADSWGGVLSTAGGLVFFGDDSGALAAVDARDGKPLWHFHTNENWKASPMTYAVDGKQFVAVAAGGNIISFGLQ